MKNNEMKSADTLINQDLEFTDSSVFNEGKRLKKLSSIIDKYLKEYLSSLEVLKESGIMAGETEKALDSYINSSKKLIGGISQIGDHLKLKTDEFVREIDDADGYLY